MQRKVPRIGLQILKSAMPDELVMKLGTPRRPVIDPSLLAQADEVIE